ncbi:MAG: helix-turn-helix transcriptional regulator [Devosiaceae bacterium]|nr:helix-turn-helix transcriptional regulator [Devosiaceae bacterium]
MSDIQTITLDDKTFVVLPIEEFEELRDIAEAERTLGRIKRGEEETLPGEIVKALVGGGHPVRVFRKYRKLTVQQLADKSGLSQPYISEIERGKKTGSAKALKAIAVALGVDLDMLV